MRLWQKVFLITFALVMAATHFVAFAQLNRHQTNSLVLSKENAKITCQSVFSEINRLVQQAKAESGSFLLTDLEMQDVIARASFDFAKENDRINISSLPILAADDRYSRVSLVQSDGPFIQVETTGFWEGRYYRVVVLSDVSQLLAQFDKDLSFMQRLGNGTALMVAMILLAVILLLTKRLNQLETVTQRIAGGQYHDRVTVSGHDEIVELSGHMNIMAERIEENINRIERVSQSRKTFIANMTHELKTPLTSILGFADILTIKGCVSDEERREYASIIAMEAKRLRLLSARLMELISLGETELVLHPANIETLIAKAIDTFSPICEERKLQICSQTSDSIVDVDEALFTSLFINLLDNACKAASPGQRIDVTLTQADGQAIVRIRDYGIGIPEDQLAHVTEAFYVGDKARSKKAGGAGIGLSLCMAIAQAHHGRLKIDSQVGRGTCVTLALPASKGGACP